MDKVLSKLPFDHKDLVAVGVFFAAVVLAVIVAKKLPVVGKQL